LTHNARVGRGTDKTGAVTSPATTTGPGP
jgi:hypothetical protein